MKLDEQEVQYTTLPSFQGDKEENWRGGGEGNAKIKFSGKSQGYIDN